MGRDSDPIQEPPQGSPPVASPTRPPQHALQQQLGVAEVPGRVQLVMRDSGVAFIALGAASERTVTLTFERLQSLREALRVAKESKACGIVIHGTHDEMFTVGADISAIRGVSDAAVGAQLAREGQALFSELEQLGIPSVAAVSGPCVGGGCELALACTYRVITDNKASQIGLPEVKLGIIPGFGGTQRLPRLVGLPQALQIILTGKVLRPKQALAIGLVDEITTAGKILGLAEELVAKARPRSRAKISLRDRVLSSFAFGRNLVRKNALATISKETKGFYPAPRAALDAIFAGYEGSRASGFDREALELGRMIVTPESKSLVHLFFLTEAAKALGKAGSTKIHDVHALVVGAGVMGAGIAGVLAKAECGVILRDTSEESLARGRQQIQKFLDSQRALSAAERSFMLNRVETTTKDSVNVGNSQFIIEAIFEDLEVKKRVLGEVAKSVSHDAIIASNTSSLSITDLARGLENPERVIGMHFFNPVEKMPLVEIVRGKHTNEKSIVLVAALATRLGKFPIVVKDVPGFLINRILTPYLNEAGRLLSEGYRAEDIDRAATDFGFPMGPLRLLDEVGLDIAVHVGEIMIKGYGERMQGPSHALTLLHAGRKGRKNGQGFYTYEVVVEKGRERERVLPFEGLSSALNLPATNMKAPDLTMIRHRLLMSLLNEAVLALDEGVAGVPGEEAANQVDLGTVMGIGFPPFRGGLFHWADSTTAPRVLAVMSELEKKYGGRFAPVQGVTLRAERGKSFHQAA